MKVKIDRPVGYWVTQIGMIFLLGWLGQLVWNAILPELFNAPHLFYWQSVGIQFLLRNVFPSPNIYGWFDIKIEEEKE